MSRPISESSTATAARLGHARNLAVKTNTAGPVTKPPPNPIPASDVRLFVTNLRLLDFDLRSDWPNITAQTFSAKNADQKQRIGGTEWALFRLFEIWDPTETAHKLRPFFPPLEPLQSLNLRAALYRCLNELKKNGLLGRESVLRKTMLDECKGEKFYEIIALFSAAVLKKVLASKGGDHPNAAVARKLATASHLSGDAQRSLIPLAIAHKAALVNVLRRKEEKRAKFKEFEATLDSKANEINKRIRKCAETPRAKRPAVPQRDADAVKRQLACNWIGNQKWLEVILHGDQVQAGDAFLSNRFDKVWHMVERGRKLEDAAPEAGLLEDLQSRVQEQQTRLQKWKNFHEELRRDSNEEASAKQKVSTTAKEFKFDDHVQHQLPVAREIEFGAVQKPAMRSSYVDILSDMDSELSRVSQAKPQPALAALRRRRRSSSSAPRSPIRTRRPSISKMVAKAPSVPAWHAEPKSLVCEPKTLVREQKALFEGLSASNSVAPIRRRSTTKRTPIDSDAGVGHQLSNIRMAAPAASASQSPVRQRFQPQREPQPIPSAAALHSRAVSVPTLEMPSLNPEDALADQIINAIGNATPSPVKKPQPRMSMSLVERTRMTLSRTPSFEPVPESPDPLPSAPPTMLPASSDDQVSNVTTLLERTRLSMAAMSNRPPQETDKKRKRKSRSSLFPVNQFETIRHRESFGALEEEESGTKTPQEDLLTGDVDYDRVFRSRPRIATSPIFSPEKYLNFDGEGDENAYEEEITGIDLGDVDQSDDEDEDGFTQNLANSPSKRPGQFRY
ncbi:HAUS augmin-like complex subunit 6 N-terminus-domain-containing protein [Boeremia exigua]|uniref:HAUS augmin-like complex subunit 6 N-terminus-domain-containing protein n=1 Tax=Boeremia exigua TaxID=749465 RepID=UPI001E8CB586|nr:HAUS augmin-like complex subunit 6 N-terminus-domain-containing protein [Boeremia exigua]KAH6612030.1 HAUS augmin-like complex subunit 6 N-terminus-domain-containing protein [Boeremia exigua]